jgi:hypothetical protein
VSFAGGGTEGPVSGGLPPPAIHIICSPLCPVFHVQSARAWLLNFCWLLRMIVINVMICAGIGDNAVSFTENDGGIMSKMFIITS